MSTSLQPNNLNLLDSANVPQTTLSFAPNPTVIPSQSVGLANTSTSASIPALPSASLTINAPSTNMLSGILNTMQGTDEITIMGFTIPKKYFYMIIAGVILILAYYAWQWYNKKYKNKDDAKIDKKENDDNNDNDDKTNKENKVQGNELNNINNMQQAYKSDKIYNDNTSDIPDYEKYKQSLKK